MKLEGYEADAVVTPSRPCAGRVCPFRLWPFARKAARYFMTGLGDYNYTDFGFSLATWCDRLLGIEGWRLLSGGFY